MGSNSSFDKARLRSVRADEQLPDDADICGTTFVSLVLIDTFRGLNDEILPQTAFNLLLSNL